MRRKEELQREFEETIRRSAIDETGTQELVLNLRKRDVTMEVVGQTHEVEIRGKLLDGRVFIDGKEVGQTPGSFTQVLSPGKHRLELRREGSFSWKSERSRRGYPGRWRPAESPP